MFLFLLRFLNSAKKRGVRGEFFELKYCFVFRPFGLISIFLWTQKNTNLRENNQNKTGQAQSAWLSSLVEGGVGRLLADSETSRVAADVDNARLIVLTGVVSVKFADKVRTTSRNTSA